MKKIQKIMAATLLLCGFGLIGADVAFAQDHGTPTEEGAQAAQAEGGMFGDKGLRGLGAGIGAGLVVMGGAAGIGRIGGDSVQSMARQPEVAGTINTAMLITAAMAEGATLFAVVVCLLLAL